MERVLRLFQRDILAADMPAYYMYAGGKRRPRTSVILSAWSRGLVVHLRCKVKGISSVIPNYFGGVPWYSVLVPFFSATGARQTPQMAVTLHRATEIKNHAIAYTFIIRLMKTGIEAEKHRLAGHYILRCLILPSYNVFNGTQQGVRRVTLRISGNSRSHEITLPVWDMGTLQSRVPRKMPAAHEKIIALR